MVNKVVQHLDSQRGFANPAFAYDREDAVLLGKEPKEQATDIFCTSDEPRFWEFRPLTTTAVLADLTREGVLSVA